MNSYIAFHFQIKLLKPEENIKMKNGAPFIYYPWLTSLTESETHFFLLAF